MPILARWPVDACSALALRSLDARAMCSRHSLADCCVVDRCSRDVASAIACLFVARPRCLLDARAAIACCTVGGRSFFDAFGFGSNEPQFVERSRRFSNLWRCPSQPHHPRRTQQALRLSELPRRARPEFKVDLGQHHRGGGVGKQPRP